MVLENNASQMGKEHCDTCYPAPRLQRECAYMRTFCLNRWKNNPVPYSWTTDSSGFVWWPPHWRQSKRSGSHQTGSPLRLHLQVHWQQWLTRPAHHHHQPISRLFGWQREGGGSLKRTKLLWVHSTDGVFYIRSAKRQNVQKCCMKRLLSVRRVFI